MKAPFIEELELKTDAIIVLNPNSNIFFLDNTPGTLGLFGKEILSDRKDHSKYFKGEVLKNGLVSYRFTNDANENTGIQNIKKPLIGWYVKNGVEFYVFNTNPVVFVVKQNDIVLEVDVGLRKGSRVYHGEIRYYNCYTDSNNDSIPDVIDTIELLTKRVGLVI